MRTWEETLEHYPNQLELTLEERARIPAQAKAYFCTVDQGQRVLLAHWSNQVIWTYNRASWLFLDDSSKVSNDLFEVPYPYKELLDNLDPIKGTATFQGKKIRWDQQWTRWIYLNNRTVHFNDSTVSRTPEEDNTLRVEELLQQTRETIVAATERLTSRNPLRPSTPQERLVPGSFSSPQTTQSPVPTSSRAKGKQPTAPPPR